MVVCDLPQSAAAKRAENRFFRMEEFSYGTSEYNEELIRVTQLADAQAKKMIPVPLEVVEQLERELQERVEVAKQLSEVDQKNG